jgi:hypothetical protein
MFFAKFDHLDSRPRINKGELYLLARGKVCILLNDSLLGLGS